METPNGNLAKGIRELNGVDTQRFNQVHAHSGGLLQGRYKAIVVQQEAYLLELGRHLVLKPVHARMGLGRLR